MRRSTGVTVNAVFALLGSLLALGFGVLMAIGMFMAASRPGVEPPKDFPFPPEFLKAIFFLVPLIYVLPAAWGISTSIGLLRLKNWARVSIMIFAGLLAAYGVFGLLGAAIFAVVPFPVGPDNRELDALVLTIVRAVFVILPLSQLALGVWWLVFFNRRTTRTQFQPLQAVTLGSPPPPPLQPVAHTLRRATPSRPISISIIAVYILIACPYMPVLLAIRAPAVLFTALVTGWVAALYYVVLLGLLIYVGIGLLRLQRTARVLGMVYLAFAILNPAAFYFAPGGHARVKQLIDWEMSKFPWLQQFQANLPVQLDLTPLITTSIMIGIVLGMVLAIVALYFLFVNKAAFHKQTLASGD